MKSAVIVFPGSNCDRDLKVAIEMVTGRVPEMVWHRESELPVGTGLIAIPGGFSYGDYLRSGAMAARSPVMRAVADAAGRGVPVLGRHVLGRLERLRDDLWNPVHQCGIENPALRLDVRDAWIAASAPEGG